MRNIILIEVLVVLSGIALVIFSDQLIKKQSLINSKRNKFNRYNEMVALNKTASNNEVVFAGDSITHWYPIHELIEDKKVYNRGNAGYFTHELLEHFDDIVLKIRPSRIVLLIGTNDMSIKHVTPKEACLNTEIIIERIKSYLPETEIHLISVYPVNVTQQPKVLKKIYKMRHYYPDKILKLNQLYKELVIKHEVSYIDIYDMLCDEHGQLDIPYTIDGLHLSTEGYKCVTEQLKKYIL